MNTKKPTAHGTGRIAKLCLQEMGQILKKFRHTLYIRRIFGKVQKLVNG
jgi:hypothetical protein